MTAAARYYGVRRPKWASCVSGDQLKINGGFMARIILILAFLAVVVAGGGYLITTVEIPPPTREVEKVIPNERFAN